MGRRVQLRVISWMVAAWVVLCATGAAAQIPTVVVGGGFGTRPGLQAMYVNLDLDLHVRRVLHLRASWTPFALNLETASNLAGYLEAFVGYPVELGRRRETRNQHVGREVHRVDGMDLPYDRYNVHQTTVARALVIEAGMVRFERAFKFLQAGESGFKKDWQAFGFLMPAFGVRYVSAWRWPQRGEDVYYAHLLLPARSLPTAPSGGGLVRDDPDETATPEHRFGWVVGTSFRPTTNSWVNLDGELGYVATGAGFFVRFGLTVPLRPLEWGRR